MIALQDKILGLLDPAGPVSTLSAGLPAPPDRYFADLRALTLVACSTWPAARYLSPSEEAASAIDQHIESLRRQAATRQAANPETAAHVSTGTPPADAAAGSGLAHIADRVLAGSTDEAREHLGLLLPTSKRIYRKRWGLSVVKEGNPCSDGMQAAYAPLLRSFTRAGGRPRGRRDAVFRPERLCPKNIPALLPEHLFTRHLTPIDGVSTKFTRRTASVRLVQMVAGGSVSEAAEFLGIRSARVSGAAGRDRTGAWQQPCPRGFDAALEAIARELDNPETPLINYQHRRQELQAWNIAEQDWVGIISRLAPSQGRPDLGDPKRQGASVYVWTRVTSGERLFAPRPLDAARPPLLRHSKAQTDVFRLLDHDGHTGPHYRSLKAELDALAVSLARTIDARRHS